MFYEDPSLFYLTARGIFGVLSGTLSVYVLFRLAARLKGERTALLAALFFAANFLHARDSHYIYADIPLVLVLLCGFIVIFRGLTPDPEDRSKKLGRLTGWTGHAAAGAMIGLATAVKYNGAFLLIPYTWVFFRKVPVRQWFPMGLVAGSAAFLVFAALNPFSILDFDFFLREIREQSAANQGNFHVLHHLRYSLMGAFTSFALLFAVLGAVKGLFSKDLRPQAVSVFIFGYYAVLCLWGQPYDRYVLPLVPFLCLTLADLIATITRALKRRVKEASSKKTWGRVHVLIAAFLVTLCLLPPLLKIFRWDWLMSNPDTRTLAKEWIETNIPTGAKIAIDREFHGPRLSFSPHQLRAKLLKASAVQARRIHALLEKPREPSYEIYFTVEDPSAFRFLFAEPVVFRRLDELRERGIRYAVTTLAGLREPDAFMKDVSEHAALVTVFSPFADGNAEAVYDDLILTGGPFLLEDISARDRNGYPILIYEVK
ncbi:MAG: Dolichyl-phosphate-mannose-protein mannosyltransferase [Candidatus Omnitrophica bacterium ADurb.Bin277]|nr:MAG: Dolichyl-phosphate-mannose-protein mannosyltransferase [Candidatus Omnitrophica bacterium ADurb.Bin277]